MGRKAYQGIVIIVATMFFLSFATIAKAVAGGEWAKPGEFPHTVQLYSIDGQYLFCGGSIIAPKVILTAAHCVRRYWMYTFLNLMLPFTYTEDKSPQNISVTAGTVVNSEWIPFHETEGQSIAVDRYVLHPNFNQYLENDIALLFLKKPLIYNDKVQPVHLPPPNVFFPSGTVAGWGITDGRNMTSPYLKKLELDFEERETCNNDPAIIMKAGFKVLCSERCAKWKKGRSICKGDSGSSVICQRPALVPDQQNKSAPSPPSIICGITSWEMSNASCGESDKIGVFLDVSQYLDWIQDTMEAQGFGNLTKQLPCSESEGFFDCGEFDLGGEKIKSRCILIGEKCDGVKNCEESRQEKMPAWLLVCVLFSIWVVIGILIAIMCWFRNLRPNQGLNSSEA